MPLPFLAAGAALGGIASLGKLVFGAHQNSQANKIHPVWQQYQTNPYAKQQLGIANQLFNGRMAGASGLERNIFANNSNYNAGVDRSATDSAQALAIKAAGMGQTNQDLSNLQIREAQNKYGMLGNLNNAYGQMIGEGQKEYESMLQKYQIDVGQKNALRQAGMGNMFGGVSDLSGLGIQLGQMQQQDKFQKDFLKSFQAV